MVLYDFDSGGPGWRGFDLQGWAFNSGEHRAKWDAFRHGYAGIRRLNEINIVAAPYLTVAGDIWGMKIDLDKRVLKQGWERTQEYLTRQMALLRERCARVSGLQRGRGA